MQWCTPTMLQSNWRRPCALVVDTALDNFTSV
jgi:hypothetical protein